MKSDFSISFIENTGSSNHLMESPDVIAKSIARLMEENEALRRLATLLTSQLDVVRKFSAAPHQSS
jgi:hypothetical protein